MANKVGRPPKFNSVEELEELINIYFDSCFGKDDNDNEIQIKPITLEGLSYSIGCDRKTIWNYRDKRDANGNEYFHAIKRAIDRCQVALAEHALNAKNPAGAIWLGINNYGYVNKQEVEVKTESIKLTTDDISKIALEED